MDFKNIYPALKDCTYLDTASSGIISKETYDWRAAHDSAFLQKGSGFRLNQENFLNELRDDISDLFNGNREHCFLVPNFSFGFNAFLKGLNPTSKILLLENDYPSVNSLVKLNGFSTETVAITADLEEQIVEKLKHYQADVFAFSLVQYLDGYKIDLSFIKKLKQQFPRLIIAADGTQYFGTENFDFKLSGLDFVAASGYKWMLGGYGNGFVLLSDQLANSIYAEKGDFAYTTEPFLKNRSKLSMFFEPGHLDTLSFGSLKQAIKERQIIGEEFIKSTITQLGLLAAEEFNERNILTKPLANGAVGQHIFNLQLSEDVLKTMTEKNIIFTRRGGGIRVGFHFYNTEADLRQLLSAIDS